MRLSARNVLAGTVRAVQQGATTAEVTLELPEGAASAANDAVDELGLAVGGQAMAVIKAPAVMIGED